MKSQSRVDVGTHVAARQVSVSSGADHAGGHQVAPPVVPGAVVVADHWEEGLLEGVSEGTSGWVQGRDAISDPPPHT